MYRTHRYIRSLFLAAALATPAAIMAGPQPRNASVQVRIYDRDHKDYHNWDDKEERAYAQYRSDNPRSAHEFSRASKRQQSQYRNWRHSHPDKD
jgi:hypothetical protein